MKQLLILVMSIVSATCSQMNKDAPTEMTQNKAIEPLYANRVVRRFSDERQKDTLSVAVNGESILTGEVDLQITNHEGRLIYRDAFPANVLLNHTGLIRPEQDEKAVKKRIDDFFDTAHFTPPMVVNSGSLNTADSGKTAWKGIQVDPTTICFSYRAGRRGLSQIAYSKDLQKVIALKR